MFEPGSAFLDEYIDNYTHIYIYIYIYIYRERERERERESRLIDRSLPGI